MKRRQILGKHFFVDLEHLSGVGYFDTDSCSPLEILTESQYHMFAERTGRTENIENLFQHNVSAA